MLVSLASGLVPSLALGLAAASLGAKKPCFAPSSSPSPSPSLASSLALSLSRALSLSPCACLPPPPLLLLVLLSPLKISKCFWLCNCVRKWQQFV